MRKATITAAVSALVVILCSVAALFAQTPAQQQQPEFVKQAQQLIHTYDRHKASVSLAQFLIQPKFVRRDTKPTG